MFLSNRGEWHFDEQWETDAPDWIDIDGWKGHDTANARFETFFPLHSTCVDILQRFTQYQSGLARSNLPKSIKDFFDACIACKEFTKEESSRIFGRKYSGTRLPDYGRYGCIEWSHMYLGARRFWSDPWDCVANQEHLCANPISEPQVDRWITECLARPKSSFQNLFSLATEPLQLQNSALGQGSLMRCPREILRLIASYLPLQSAINLHASSRQLSSLIVASEGDFWRSHTLRLHGAWFWELWDYQGSSIESSSNTNWEVLLIALSASRREIAKEAQPYWLESTTNKHIDVLRKYERSSYKDLPSLPLGLRNRQRIWMCLESLDMDGKSEALKQDRIGRPIYRQRFL